MRQMFIDDALFNQCTDLYDCFPNKLTAQSRNLLVVSPEEESETSGLRCELELYRSGRAINVGLRVEGESVPEAVWGNTLQPTDTARNTFNTVTGHSQHCNTVACSSARDLSYRNPCSSYREACHSAHWQPAMSRRHAWCV